MRILIGIVLLLSVTFASAARFEVAVANYDQGNYARAMEQFIELASLGNKDAQFSIGLMYFKGEGVEKSLADAYAWIALSGTKGNSGYVQTLDNFNNKFSAEVLAEGKLKLAQLKEQYGDATIDAKLQPNLEEKPIGGYKTYRPLKKPYPEYPRTALKKGVVGSVMVNYIVGADGRTKHHQIVSYSDDLLLKESLRTSRKFLYEPASIFNSPVDTFGVTNRFMFAIKNTQVNSKKIKKGLVELLETARMGSSVDRYKYALHAQTLLSYVDEQDRDQFDNPNIWFAKAAIDGLPEAKYELGRRVLYGEQCEGNYDQSYFWLTGAAKDGLPSAQTLLGMERYYGIRFEKDEQQGLTYLEAAAESYDIAKIEYAKILVLSENEKIRDLSKAKQYLANVNEKELIDKLSLYEVSTLLAMQQGVESDIKAEMKRLKKELKDLDISYSKFEQNLNNQIEGKPVTKLL